MSLFQDREERGSECGSERGSECGSESGSEHGLVGSCDKDVQPPAYVGVMLSCVLGPG